MSDVRHNFPVNKLILLYFVEKTGAAVSNSQITQFMLEYNYMDYFSLQTGIDELCQTQHLAKNRQNKRVLYYITDTGIEALGYFHYMIPELAKNNVNGYLHENKRKIQAELDVSANYFPSGGGEYLVKCALIEGSGKMLMEISLVTASKELAKKVCENWKNDTGACYKEITSILFRAKKDEETKSDNAEG